MAEVVTLESALRCAVITAIEQHAQVPEAPIGWVAQAQAALNAGDEAAMVDCADNLLRVHRNYCADFDVKGWLFDLRNVRFEANRARNAAARLAADGGTDTTAEAALRRQSI